MKLIIDIPNEAYEAFKERHKNKVATVEQSLIANGIPYEERPQGDFKSGEALKAYAREVLCGNNPINSLLIRMFDEIIDNTPTCGL